MIVNLELDDSKAMSMMRVLSFKDLAQIAKLQGSDFQARWPARNPRDLPGGVTITADAILWLAEVAMKGLEK